MNNKMAYFSGDSGMTLIDLIVYMAIASVFMVGALFLMGSGNAFSKEAKAVMDVQNEFRLASISIKNTLRRYDYTDGFQLIPIDINNPDSDKKLSFYAEGVNTQEVASIYYDVTSKKLIERKTVTIGSQGGGGTTQVRVREICRLDRLAFEMDKTKKTVTVDMSYSVQGKFYSYKEVFHYKCDKFKAVAP